MNHTNRTTYSAPPYQIGFYLDIKPRTHARKYRNPGYYPIPPESLKQEIRERDHYTCQLCGKPNSKHVDHIIPLEISHDNSRGNLRVLCHHCNLLRGNIFGKKSTCSFSGFDQWADRIKEELQNLHKTILVGG